MSDATTPLPELPPIPAREFDPVEVFALLGGELRWAILRLLAKGQPRTTTELAALLRRDFDGVRKHLGLLRDAGLLECREGEDRRQVLFYLPERFRQTPGLLNFGVCAVRLP